MLRTWVGDNFGFGQTPARFHYTLWNHYDTKDIRTNNNVEGYHSKLRSIISSPKPNIYAIVEIIRNEDATARSKFERVNSDILHARPNAQALFREERLENLRLKLKLEPDYDLSDYFSDCFLFAATFSQK